MFGILKGVGAKLCVNMCMDKNDSTSTCSLCWPGVEIRKKIQGSSGPLPLTFKGSSLIFKGPCFAASWTFNEKSPISFTSYLRKVMGLRQLSWVFDPLTRGPLFQTLVLTIFVWNQQDSSFNFVTYGPFTESSEVFTYGPFTESLILRSIFTMFVL